MMSCFFFFQAEDGIRDGHVTGVQTCALPIYFGWSEREGPFRAENRQIYPLPEDDAENGFTYPVAAYDHNRDPGQTGDAGIALNGGFVYRGNIPELQDQYLFTDLVHGWVLSTEHEEMVRNDGDVDALAEISQLRVFADGEETTFAELVGDSRVY